MNHNWCFILHKKHNVFCIRTRVESLFCAKHRGLAENTRSNQTCINRVLKPIQTSPNFVCKNAMWEHLLANRRGAPNLGLENRQNPTCLQHWFIWGRTCLFGSRKNTMFLSCKPELRVYFVQKHIVSELQTRVASLLCAKSHCF